MRKSLKNFIPLIIIFISFSTVVYAESTNGLTSPKDLIDTDGGVVLELDREANYVFDSDPDQSWYEIDVDTKIANFFLWCTQISNQCNLFCGYFRLHSIAFYNI